MRYTRHGFSLVELLVVIGIIVLLLGILMPVLVGARKTARATVCLSHLQQLGDAFLMYRNANGGHSFPNRTTITEPDWWERLGADQGAMKSVVLCPEATEPGNVLGSATTAWGPDRSFSVGAPQWMLRASCVGSYGLNGWLVELTQEEKGGASAWWLNHAIHLPAAHPSEVPTFADCMMAFGTPTDTDTVPTDLIHPLPYYSGVGPKPNGPSGAMAYFCLDRHGRAVNVVFLDGHAERVPLAGLWKLRWNSAFKPSEVVVP